MKLFSTLVTSSLASPAEYIHIADNSGPIGFDNRILTYDPSSGPVDINPRSGISIARSGPNESDRAYASFVNNIEIVETMLDYLVRP